MMKFLITHFLFLVASNCITAQSGQWIWMRGDSTDNKQGTWGDPDVQDSSYYPPSLDLASSWEDDSGRFWLFGGATYEGDQDDKCYDRIWRYDPVSDFWDYIKGTSQVDGQGTYGTKGVGDPDNNPGGRRGAMIWKDHSNTIWMFGGENAALHAYNDLWKYDMTTNIWTWVKGPNHWDEDGKYGAKGVPKENNLPPVRADAAAWVDTSNDLWMFGGQHYGSTQEYYNDLWRYNIDSNMWTWMGGSKLVDQGGKYGTKGVPDTDNIPGSRSCHCYWSDSNYFYLFGGDSLYEFTYYHGDVWRYNKDTEEWTWLNGTSKDNEPGVPGTYCEFDSINYPITRSKTACVKLDSHRILMFGGALKWAFSQASNSRDTWIYDYVSNEWTRIWGDSTAFDGYYGTQGVYDPNNDPQGRLGHAIWKGENESVWIYGGTACVWDCSLSDLWKYTLDPSCGGIPTSINTTPNNSIEFNISPNPSSSSINIQYSITQTSTLTITDAYGRVVKQLTLYPYFKNRVVYLEGLAQGVYLVTLEGDGKRVSEKLVVQ